MPLTGSSAGCNAHTLLDYLADRGLTAYGQSDPASLNDRNRDRLRVLRYLAQHPEGARQTVIVHDVLKGVDPSTYTGYFTFDQEPDWQDRLWTKQGYVALDGSDSDYTFLNRFINDLTENTDLVRTEALAGDDAKQRFVYPKPSLFDLISEGISETDQASDDLVYDREWCLNLLESKRDTYKRLTDSEKDHLANSLRRYIQRVRDYRLAFDVCLVTRSGRDVRRMEKPYATRFTDPGRIDQQYAMLQSALEEGYDIAETAVFCTLTTDPKKFDSLLDAIMAINDNFHALTQWMKRDPSTKPDTRKKPVNAWYGPDCGVTGRPREKLEYVKVLEFTESGYPHLHVLFFDPPCRESDGMPWLCDKAELSHQWNKDTEKRTGQGQIVDTWPLVYRDDLDEIDDAEFNDSEGFVSWYRYGDHDHDQDWIEAHSNQHDQIDFDGDEDNPMEKTAGAYIGKYVSETQGLLQNLESLDDPSWTGETQGKSAWWKLALYWATQRRFWSPSRNIRQRIKLDDDRADVRRGVRDATRSTLHRLTDDLHDPHALYPDPADDVLDDYLADLARDLVAEADVDAQQAHDTQTALAHVWYLGAYHRDDMPASPHQSLDHRPLEAATHGPDADVTLASTGDRPPPTADAWS